MKKVYVIEVGAYSDRYIDAIFTTRELADAYVDAKRRKGFERQVGKAWSVPTYEDFCKQQDESWVNDHGYVEEYDLWDMVPVVAE